MDPQRLEDLLFILHELDSTGYISFNAEWQKVTPKRKRQKPTYVMVALHVVPHPAKEQFFADYYEDKVQQVQLAQVQSQP